MIFSSRTGKVLASAAVLSLVGGFLSTTAANAVEEAPPAAIESDVDFFADSYPALEPDSVFASTQYEYLTDILGSNGTYAIVFGGPHQDSTQNTIAHIDDVARDYGVDTVYHFDPLLGGDVLDITDPTGSVAFGSNNYYKLFTDLKSRLINIDPAYEDSSDTYVFTYDKNHTDANGDSAPIISGVVEDSANFTSDAEVAEYRAKLAQVFDAVKGEDGRAQLDTRDQFDYFRTTHTAKGNDQTIIPEESRDGWVLEAITYPELVHLLESGGSHTITTGNAWCPNARAIYRWLNDNAVENGIKKVYVFDVRLDGASNNFSITNDSNRFNFLDAKLIEDYFTNAQTDITNPQLKYYPDGDTSQEQLTTAGRKFLNPFVFQYQKDHVDAEGNPKPLKHQWTYANAEGDPKEYQLTWANTKNWDKREVPDTPTGQLTKQGLEQLETFFEEVAADRATLLPNDPGDRPREGRLSATAADGCGDEDDLIDISYSENLLPNSGTTDYDVRHYDIDLEYAPGETSSKTSVTAKTTIRAVSRKSLTRISLDARRFNIQSLKVNGAAAASYQQINIDHGDIQKLHVTPATPVAEGAEFTVEVEYTTGTVDAFKAAGESNQGFFPSQNSKGATALGQPFGSTYWFPNNNSTIDRATYRVALTAPQELTGVAIGELESIKRKDGKVTRTWVQNTGTIPYQTLASFGDYKEFKQSHELRDGRVITLRSYADRTLYNSSTAKQLQIEKQLQSQSAVIDWAEGRFGAYPGVAGGAVYEELLNASREPIALGGLETNGRIFYSRVPGGNTFVHEYIHQWFGNGVTIGSYNDLWLNEGFATYFANVYYEDTADLDAVEQYRQWFAANDDDDFWAVAPGALGSEANLFSNAVYGRGGYVLAALRVAVGDELFTEFVREWFAAKVGGSGTTAEFAELAEEVTNRDLGEFFGAWLYGAGRPDAFPSEQLPEREPGAEKATPTVSVKPGKASVRYGAANTARITVRADGAAAEGHVKVSYAGKTVASRAKLTGGTATVTLPKTVKPGSRNLSVAYLGTETVAAGQATTTVRVLKAKTTVGAKLAKKSVKASQRGRVVVNAKLSGASGVHPTGKVQVLRGSKVIKTVTLKASQKGRTTVTLPKLKKGTHQLRVKLPSSSTRSAVTSKRVTLRVR
ncbi:Ig-like domain repeat protein [Leucobacter weissii]|uniref:Ig-like domain repeat protein n=1 Tax=Leucobacter weissii TaxID=1983706 RepID=A0A939S9X1_9MICO|nr:Ig-like domain repeat protein [Leucobacter weissii]